MEKFLWYDTTDSRVIRSDDGRGVRTDAFDSREEADAALADYIERNDIPEGRGDEIVLLQAEVTRTYASDAYDWE